MLSDRWSQCFVDKLWLLEGWGTILSLRKTGGKDVSMVFQCLVSQRGGERRGGAGIEIAEGD